MKLLLLALCASSITSAGAITSGDITFDAHQRIGAFTLSGPDFQASGAGISGQLLNPIGVFTPGFMIFPPGAQVDLSVTVGAIQYVSFPGLGPPPAGANSVTIATLTFAGGGPLVSGPDLVTGPGDYPVTLSVNLTFCLFSSTVNTCEQETGLVDTVFTYVDPLPNGFVDLQPLDFSDFIPEPSSWALCLSGLLFCAWREVRRRERQTAAAGRTGT